MTEMRTLGDYTLIKQVGHGSMGLVYLAEHRFMKKQYVLKVLPEELSSDRAFIQRFEEEVGQLALVEHPHIVKVHNISFAQGQYFLVTDCVVDEFGETTNLAQYMISRGRRFEEETLFRLLRQIAEAIDFAHSKNPCLIHRNLKLNNILVAKGRGGIDLVVSDFGLSRIIGTAAVLTRTYKTVAEALGIAGPLYGIRTGQDRYPNPPIDIQKQIPLQASFLQNYAFLAPEQRRLDYPGGVTAQADVYAFGVLVYYLLMEEFPEGIFDMPSVRFSESMWRWDALIHACLQADPNKRPTSLLDILDGIRHHSKGFAVKGVTIDKNNESIVISNPNTAVEEITKTFSMAPDNKSHTGEGCSLTRDAVEPLAAVCVESLPRANTVEESALDSNASTQATSLLKPIIRTAEIERPRADLDPTQMLLVDSTVKHYIPELKEIKNIQPIVSEMSVIAGGEFQRGSKDGNRDEMPRHRIFLDSFAIDIHPITNEQFVRFLDLLGGEKDGNHQDVIRMRDSRIKRVGGKLSIESGYSKHPVVGVTWYGAIAYSKWVGKRLPTEAEWEIAARGGLESVLFPTGDDIEKNQSNFFSSDTTAVMSYAPNGHGLYDMAGNVYEWCYDWYGYNYYEVSVQEPENPKGPLQGVYRVLRGGCWKSLKEDLRCSRRHRNNPGTVNGTYGFRCAADVGDEG